MTETKPADCRYGRQCVRDECRFFHPKGRVVDEPADRFLPPPTGQLCKFGNECRRPGCKFIHPQGRKMEAPPSMQLKISMSDKWLSFRPILVTDTQSLIQELLVERLRIKSEEILGFVLPNGDGEYWIQTSSYQVASSAYNRLLTQEWSKRVLVRDDVPPALPITTPSKHSTDANPKIASQVETTSPTLVSDDLTPAQIAERVREPYSPIPPTTVDGSISDVVMMERLRRLTSETVIIIDGDNVPDTVSFLLELFPLPQPPGVKYGFHVFAFVGVTANFRHFPMAAQLSCFSYTRALTSAKDATDHDLTIFTTLANIRLPVPAAIYLVSRDGFARELLAKMRLLERDRTIELIPKDIFREVITSFQFRSSISPGRYILDIQPPPKDVTITKAVPIPPPSPLSMPSIVKTSDETGLRLPGPEHPCPICRKPGGLHDSHWYWKCPLPDLRYVDKDHDPAVKLNIENDRYTRFVGILDEYLRSGVTVVRLSNLGMLLKQRFVYSEKSGLKPLIERGVDDKLLIRQGEQGMAEVILLPGSIATFINTLTKK